MTLKMKVEFEEGADEGAVMEEVLQLPEDYREIIYLYYYEGYNTEEIARILNLNVSTVRTKLSRGRGRLKGMLEEHGEARDESL